MPRQAFFNGQRLAMQPAGGHLGAENREGNAARAQARIDPGRFKGGGGRFGRFKRFGRLPEGGSQRADERQAVGRGAAHGGKTLGLGPLRLQAGGGDVMLFSALKRQGVAEAACWLRARVEQAGGPEQALA